jgi:hypothetical protein
MFKIICSTIDLALVIGEQPGGVWRKPAVQAELSIQL